MIKQELVPYTTGYFSLEERGMLSTSRQEFCFNYQQFLALYLLYSVYYEHCGTFPIHAESTFRSFLIEFRKLSWKSNLICGYILDEKPQNMTVHFYYLAFFLFCCHWAFFVPTFTLRSKTITKRPLNSLKMIILSYQAVKSANPTSSTLFEANRYQKLDK